ncbi:polysaccharide deacetylase family protein [bacterium]|nr:polysaccharide deacetylase family protein [bacterium]
MPARCRTSDAQPPPALIQVDLDAVWAVREVYGLSTSEPDRKTDPVYHDALPAFLDLFEEYGVRATFFAVGMDAEDEGKAARLRQAVEAGHEVANHSYTHQIGLGALPSDDIDAEISQAQQCLERATGTTPVGFRSPGYDASPAVLQAVGRAGLLYDASMLPTYLGPALRAVSRKLSQHGKAGGGRGHYGQGSWRAPRHPYFADPDRPWKPAVENGIPELPVSVTRRFRAPFHASVGMVLGTTWTARTLRAFRREGTPLIYLLHGVDLCSPRSLTDLAKGRLGRRLFGRGIEEKRSFVRTVLEYVSKEFEPSRSVDYIHANMPVCCSVGRAGMPQAG